MRAEMDLIRNQQKYGGNIITIKITKEIMRSGPWKPGFKYAASFRATSRSIMAIRVSRTAQTVECEWLFMLCFIHKIRLHRITLMRCKTFDYFQAQENKRFQNPFRKSHSSTLFFHRPPVMTMCLDLST